MQRARVAIVRGPYLNPFEMQTYTYLRDRFDLTAFGTYDNLFDLRDVALPVRRLHRPKEFGFDVPRWRGLVNVSTRLVFGSEDRMVGLERELEKCDIIHGAETYNYFSFQAVRVKARTGVPVVLTAWETIPHNRDNISQYARCKAEVRKQADLFLAVTEEAKIALLNEEVDPKKVRVIGAGVDTERFSPGSAPSHWRGRFGMSEAHTVILYVGSLIRSKGLDDLLAATYLLAESGVIQASAHRVLIIGKGPEAARLDDKSHQLGLAQIVTFGGSVSYADMPAIHRLADIFVLPSIPTPTWEEQFGMVLVESMASGKAVVSTMSGAIPGVIGDAGVLISPGDPAALAGVLQQLLSDEVQRASLGRRARHRIQSHFAHHIVAEKIAAAYGELL